MTEREKLADDVRDDVRVYVGHNVPSAGRWKALSKAEARADRAEAECERMRAERDAAQKSEREWKRWRATAVKACDRAESRLAAANALLDSIEREMRGTPNVSAVLALLSKRGSRANIAGPATPGCEHVGQKADLIEQRCRTEAEQAVLDAMGDVTVWNEQALRIYARANPLEGYGARWTPLECRLAPVCRAELARRGLGR